MKKSKLLLLLALCGVLSLTGCRKKVAETESETQTETVSETESETEKKKPKETEKTSEKTTENKNTKTTEKKKVKPSAVNNNTTNSTNSTNNNTATTATERCPYCGNYISTAPNADGTSEYSAHVAQEQAWAEYIGATTEAPGSTPSTDANQGTQGQTEQPQTQAPTTETPATDAPSENDVAQCGICFQWFTVSDGSYEAHIAAENANLGLPSDTEYLLCPICGNSYPKGNMYDNHVCTPAQ